MAVEVTLDPDVEVRVKAFADGIGVPLAEVIGRAVVFALRSRFPNNALPEVDAPVDPDYGVDEGAEVDNELPEEQPEVDNSLPGGGICPVFDPTVDNELPDSEVPLPEPK